MQAVEAAVKVYVGDSTTDLPCLVNASFGLIMKPKDEYDGSSIGKVISKTKPPVKAFYRDYEEFLTSHNKERVDEKEGGVLIRVDDWTQALEVIRHIQERFVRAE